MIYLKTVKYVIKGEGKGIQEEVVSILHLALRIYTSVLCIYNVIHQAATKNAIQGDILQTITDK